MGSFNDKGRDRRSPRRRGPNDRDRRRQALPILEPLENRRLLAAPGYGPPTWVPTTTNIADVKNGPLAKAGQDLISLYQEYQTYLANDGVAGQFHSKQAGRLEIQGTNVGVDVNVYGDLNAYALAAARLGMKIGAIDTATGIVEGVVPIAQLPALVNVAGTVGVAPIYMPFTHSVGSATDQGEAVMQANTAKTTYGVDGTGQTVGVLSDSVSQVGGGIADSVKTGDLPAGVTVLQDGPAGSTDEGRAMLEEVHDIAPGAKLQFTTADGGEVAFANGIRSLASAGSTIIADDIGYPTEPFFQDGVVSQAVDQVAAQNITYLSAAGNTADSGYQSVFRGANGTVTGVGSGRFMNFDPNGGTALTIGINVYRPSQITFMYDNPFYTTNGVTSDLDIYVLDANNNVVASGTTNNIATQTPFEILQPVQPGLYKVAIKVNAGSPDVGRVAFYEPGDGGFSVDHQYGFAGGTNYPTTNGHPTANGALGIGAVPWFNAPPFDTLPSYSNEPFSSFGPSEIVFSPTGAPLGTTQVRQKPDVSGPDGIDTSFFPVPAAQNTLSTLNPPFPQSSAPPYPGEPATVTGEQATTTELDGNALPNFFGTSAATPNVAGVVALMRQFSPSTTNADISSALKSTTIPLDGTPAGSWGAQSGYGLVQATRAIAALDTFHVTATDPPNLYAETSAPSQIVFAFNGAVDPGTLQPGDLTFLGTPAGVTVTVGQPYLDPANNNVVHFPLTYNIAAGAKANGGYYYQLNAKSITSAANKSVALYSGAFGIADTIAPKVTNVTINGRYINIQFSEAMNPATINKTDIYLERTGSSGVFGSPTNVNLNLDPRAIVAYNAATNTAVLDLSQLDQSELPTDHYALIVTDATTDVVGNRLDGEFSGLFPSGNGVEGGNFVDDLGVRTLTPPQILSLQLAPAYDSGIKGDQNTNNQLPAFVGQVQANFPGTAGGLTVVAEFNALHQGTFDLAQGAGGRGFTGNFDVQVTTDAQGRFAFVAPTALPNGFQTVRVVVVGASDSPPLPGLSSLLENSFRIVTNSPLITTDGSSIQQGQKVPTLTNVTLDVLDPVLPSDLGNPLAVPTQFSVPALDPATADNISNYSLVNLGSDNAIGGTTSDTADKDYSSYITSANFVTTGQRTATNDPFLGQINLTFAPGLPAGRYLVIAHRPQPGYQGITDAAGNQIDADLNTPGAQDFVLVVDVNPTPAYITGFYAVTPDSLGGAPTLTGPKSYYEIPVPGNTPRAVAPPNQFYIDFSSPLNTAADYTNDVELIRSANSPTAASDGDFGTDPTYTSGVGYTRVPGVTVTLVNSILGATFGTPGYKNRLVVSIAPGTSLPADHYRFFIPNAVLSNGQDTRIFDQFGNQLDGEFLGTPSISGNGTYEDLLPTGQYRPDDLSGDGTPGGSFETGFIVVPNGNIIYARPDYVDDPFLTSDDPDGSLAHPYPVLAPEAVANAANGGDLNSVANFGTGFNSVYDRSGNGHFDRSALYAADVLSAKGPVVVVALPALNDKSKTFVLQAPSGSNPVANDGSATVPFNTDLVFAPGSVLKLSNAALFVQNQGSSIQVIGGPNPADQVVFTSYADDSVGGDTNGDGADSSPLGGDWGGIVLRNFDDTSNGGRPIPEAPGPVDPLRNHLGVSGEDDALSYFNFAQVKYAGGAVPQTIGFRFDAITNFNSRPAISNIVISQTGGTNSPQGAISGDVDSFREDNLARGILVRRATLINNSLNGIYVRAELTGVAEPTDAMTYPDNPITLGGQQNYSFFAPVPYVLVARLVLGETLQQDTNGKTVANTDRYYFQPGTVFKFQRGAGIDVNNPGASLNIGDRTYINEFDANPNLAPTDAGFKAPTVGDAQVVFTSLFDDNATTSYTDPNTGVASTIVAPIDTDNGGAVNLPTPGNVPALARWGGIAIISGAISVIDEADFRYGGGSVNSANGTIPQRDVLDFEQPGGGQLTGTGAGGQIGLTLFGQQIIKALGTTAYTTNNTFEDNAQAPMSIDPNGLLAADPLRPLKSGNPFFRGNVFLRNDLNGLEVLPRFQGVTGYNPNLRVDSVWDDTDLTYILRGTISLAGAEIRNMYPTPDSTQFTDELKPAITLTIESSLPGTLLANGQTIGLPGESNIVKLLNTTAPVGDGVNGGQGITSDEQGGAGFLVGVDDTVDPPADPLTDPGFFSQIRILGIGGNATTGQQRVPVIITSLHDNTVGRTVRGVDQYAAMFGNSTAPAAGDGGVIEFGANSLSDYNLLDPRDGSLIDNADIKYITRVEQQGGGWVYTNTGNNRVDKIGNTPATQFNTAKAMTISDSNFSNFSQVGFIAHPSGATQIDLLAAPVGTFQLPARDTILHGQPTLTYFVNDTFSNMPVGVRINADGGADLNGQTPSEAVFLNNTFYNDPVSVHLDAPIATGLNNFSHNNVLFMDNIFANSSTAAIQIVGQDYGSQGQYNFFSGDTTDVSLTSDSGFSNNEPVTGNPAFLDAANGNFQLLPNSDAIDASRSELGPTNLGLSLLPIADQQLNSTGGVRNATGRTNFSGGLRDVSKPGDIVTLPGYPLHFNDGAGNFYDQWVPAIAGTPGAIPGPTTNAGGVFSYTPITGERDQAGYLRVDDPNVANVGFGSRPFFDIGAYEYVQLNPPHITNVIATLPNPAVPGGEADTLIYTAGQVLGTNQTPDQLVLFFDQRLDPTTVNNMTILLQASGGDGIFDNGNDKFISLSGKLVYDPVAKTITINLASSNLTLANDTYRLIVYGSGSNVIRNPQGLALDGENTVGDQPNQPTLPLPSGDGFPGGNFFLTFTVDNHPPAIVGGTFNLAPSSDTGIGGDRITDQNRPNFVGRITDVAPPVNPLLNETVYIDVSTKGNGVFDRLGVAVGKTDALGNFIATYVPGQAPLPDSAYSVGPDGILGTADDSGYSVARVRIVDQSGNVSSLSDANALLSFVVDTTGPRVTGSSPLPNSQPPVTAGTIPVALVVSENINPATFTAQSVKVTRSGPDGVLGTADDVSVAVDPASFSIENLHSTSGSEILHFNIIGATASDLYQVTLLGTGTSAVQDIAGNDLDGEFGGTFPSGNGTPGGDFNLTFIVYNPASTHLIFVGQTATTPTATPGTRANPYPTITAGMNAANPGDIVAVLPGVYTENVTLKSLVRLLSADNSSTDSHFVPGLALQTVIRAPANNGAPTTTVTGTNLYSIPALSTEIAGFTIASPLNGDTAHGPILDGSVGLLLSNSDVLVDKNYFVDSYIGAGVGFNGANAAAPRFESDGFIGNITGLVVNAGATTSFRNNQDVEIANNDFAFNTYGYFQITTATTGPILADVVNNIFWQNADRSGFRNGTAILTNVPGRMTVQYNLFSGNGPSDSSPADDTVNVGGGFDPTVLGTTPDAFGNITGAPAFALPVDPRPDGDGPGNFFLAANYDLTASSAAIDEALNADAPIVDFRYRGRIAIPGHGRTGTGPADIGAFEYLGTYGVGSGTAFNASSVRVIGPPGVPNQSASSGSSSSGGTTSSGGTGTTSGAGTTSGGTTSSGGTTTAGGRGPTTTTSPTTTTPKVGKKKAKVVKHKVAKKKPSGPLGLISKFHKKH